MCCISIRQGYQKVFPKIMFAMFVKQSSQYYNSCWSSVYRFYDQLFRKTCKVEINKEFISNLAR